MKAIIYEIPTNCPKMGEYKPTTIDEEKKNVDFLIKEAYHNGYVIRFNKIEIETKRGIEKLNEKTYFVTDRALKTIQKQFTCACDF